MSKFIYWTEEWLYYFDAYTHKLLLFYDRQIETLLRNCHKNRSRNWISAAFKGLNGD